MILTCFVFDGEFVVLVTVDEHWPMNDHIGITVFLSFWIMMILTCFSYTCCTWPDPWLYGFRLIYVCCIITYYPRYLLTLGCSSNYNNIQFNQYGATFIRANLKTTKTNVNVIHIGQNRCLRSVKNLYFRFFLLFRIWDSSITRVNYTCYFSVVWVFIWYVMFNMCVLL